MTKDFKVNNNASLSPGEVKEILDACNRQFKNSKGKEFLKNILIKIIQDLI